MIVAKYLDGGTTRMGAIARSAAAVHAPATLGKRRATSSTLLKTSNTGLPGAIKVDPNAGHTLGRRNVSSTPAATSRPAIPPPAPTAPEGTPINYGAPSSSSSSGGGGAVSGAYDFVSRGADASAKPADVPTGDAYVSVSGGIPNGALYAIMAGVVLAGGVALWKRSKRK